MGLEAYPTPSQPSNPNHHPDLDNTTLPLSSSFPAQTLSATTTLNQTPTTATSLSFTDTLLITITQSGHLSQWITVPLESTNPTHSDPHFALFPQSSHSDPNPDSEDRDSSLIPMSRFQPRILLGAGGPEREVLGQLLATQIAGLVVSRDRAEGRKLLVGLGFEKVERDREFVLGILELVTRVL